MSNYNKKTILKKYKLHSPLHFALIVVLALSISGCSAQLAFNNGRSLFERGEHIAGLAKLKQASELAPSDAVYKSTYLRTKELLLQRLNTSAELAIRQRNFKKAREDYQEILLIEPNNKVGLSGMQNTAKEEDAFKAFKKIKSSIENNTNPTDIVTLNELKKFMSIRDDVLKLISEQESISNKSEKSSQVSNALKRSINIELREASLKQIFDIIARTAGLNFIFDKEVRTEQRSSIFLKNSTVEMALYYALLTNQLEHQVIDKNTILIYPNNPNKIKEYQELNVKAFFINNGDAKNIGNTLKTLLKTKDIVIDERLNLLIVRDSPEAIKLAKRIIEMQDIPEPEVMLEVEIIEVKRTLLNELGIKWPESVSLAPISSNPSGGLTLRELTSTINSKSTSVAVSPVTVNAKWQDSDVNILANPRIRARNHEKAKIQIGERVPSVTTTSTTTFVSESVNYLDVGLKLEVEPTVYLDDDVGIKVNMEVSNIVSQGQTKAGSSTYQLGTRSASTTLRLRNGETQILAGLISNEDRVNASKLPGLGSLPVIGKLFGSSLNNSEKTEIILSITPRLIRNIQIPDTSVVEFSTGTEFSIKAKPELDPQATNKVKMNSGEENFSHHQILGEEQALERSFAADTVKKPAIIAVHFPEKLQNNEEFPLHISIQANQLVTSVGFDLDFDPNIFSVNQVIEGNFFSGNPTLENCQKAFGVPGKLTIICNSNSKENFTKTGVVTSIIFRSKAKADSTKINLTNVRILDINRSLLSDTKPAEHVLRVE